MNKYWYILTIEISCNSCQTFSNEIKMFNSMKQMQKVADEVLQKAMAEKCKGFHGYSLYRATGVKKEKPKYLKTVGAQFN